MAADRNIESCARVIFTHSTIALCSTSKSRGACTVVFEDSLAATGGMYYLYNRLGIVQSYIATGCSRADLLGHDRRFDCCQRPRCECAVSFIALRGWPEARGKQVISSNTLTVVGLDPILHRSLTLLAKCLYEAN
eukprot:scaffold4510_cov183-Amphora_coffeaeformis.AAC.80